jgi:lipopolysaccharide transport protein LptA
VKTIRSTVLVVAAVCMLASSALAAAKAKGPKPPAKLKLNAKSIVFDREKGDINLDKDVVVTRTQGDEVLVVHCNKMRAKMKDGKIEEVTATGNVRIVSGETKAWAPRAEFDFKKNIIHLFADAKTLARMATDKVESTGKQIIYHGDTQKIQVIEGESKFKLEDSRDVKKDGAKKTPK